jgi:diguanylate cyclase (GGDEF)-like protein
MAEAGTAAATIAEEMAGLRNAYLERLPPEVAELGALAQALTGSETDGPKLESLHQRLHKLAGSGGTFGLTALSERCRDLELQAKRWLDDPSILRDADTRGRFAEGVAALASALTQAPPAVMPVPPPSVASAESGKSIHVWLVEDDLLLGQELARLLEPFSYEVRLFTRIRDAETAAPGTRPDILIMDVLFPEEAEDAADAASLRATLRALGCPLIFISSQGDFQSRVRAARLGAEGYFQKPLDAPRLVDRVEQIFQRRLSPPQRVMIVDDDLCLAEHFRLVLQGAGMKAEVLSQPEDIIERLAAFRPELVLMDMHMPGYSGPDLAGVIRQHDNWISLPIVYLSAETDFDQQIQALGRGADDFLTKPISDAQLIAAVRVRVERARQLADQISKDSLTGLLRHASIKEAAEVEVVRSRRSGKPVSVAILDIDHFKAVNDTWGHAVGDLVIKSIATLLRQRLRQSDIIGRYGGEEFVVVLPECPIDFARLILEDIRTRFGALQFGRDGHNFSCTVSGGLACSADQPGATGAGLLVAADQALYVAKRSGRDQVSMAAPITQAGSPS